VAIMSHRLQQPHQQPNCQTIGIFEEEDEYESEEYSVSWVKPAVGSTYTSKFNGAERRRSVSAQSIKCVSPQKGDRAATHAD